MVAFALVHPHGDEVGASASSSSSLRRRPPSSSSSIRSSSASHVVAPLCVSVLLLARAAEATGAAFVVPSSSSSSRRWTLAGNNGRPPAAVRAARRHSSPAMGLSSASSGVNGDASGGEGVNGDGAGAEEPDLFEYFDPLLSPHAYPRGISPDSPPSSDATDGGGVSRGGVESYGRRSPNFAQGASSTSSGGGGSGGFIEVPEDVKDGVGGGDGGGVRGDESAPQAAPDLLDYFDPLLSPHAYPDGIDAAAAAASTKSEKSGTDESGDEEDDEHWSPLRMRSSNTDSFFGEGASAPSSTSADSARSRSSEAKGRKISVRRSKTVIRSSITGKRVYKRPHGLDDDDEGADALPQEDAEAGGANEETDEKKPDLFDVFDPRVSPHAYAEGIPDAITYEDGSSSVTYSAFRSPAPGAPKTNSNGAPGERKSSVVVGVLLIDHGSRRGLSNARLRTLSLKYNDITPDDYVVKHAHMEIAKPSIEDGLRTLVVEEGCTHVMCVPYFLSVGKHSTIDVPRLIDEACATLEIGGGGGGGSDVTVVTTDPVGSNVDIMLGAIDTLVQGALEELDDELLGGGMEEPEKGPELGGLFGDIKRMMDEQL